MASNVLNGIYDAGTVPGALSTPTSGVKDNPVVFNGSVYANNQLIDLTAIGGGGTFDPESMVSFEPDAPAGGDGSLSKPFNSMQAAIDSLGIPVTPKVVVSRSAGFHDENVTIDSRNTAIFAPSLVLAPSSGDALTINAPAANAIGVTIGGLAIAGAGNALNIIDSNPAIINAEIISGDVTISSASAYTLNCRNLEFSTLTLGGSSLLNCNVISTVNFSFADLTSETNTRGRVGLNWYGTFLFNGLTRILRSNIFNAGGTFQISATHFGLLVNASSGSPITITLPQESTLSIPVGTKGQVLRGGTGTVTFAVTGSDSIIGGVSQIPAQGNIVEWHKVAESGGVSTWAIGGAT